MTEVQYVDATEPTDVAAAPFRDAGLNRDHGMGCIPAEMGIGLAGVHRSTPVGMGAACALRAIDRGFIALIFTKSLPATPMWGGRTAFPGASPIAAGIPGAAIAEIDGVCHRLGTFDTTCIPAPVPHRFITPTDRPRRFFWTYASLETTRTMLATGQTRTIEAEHGQPSARRGKESPSCRAP